MEKKKKKNFMKLCKEHREVSRILLQAHPQEKCIPGLKIRKLKLVPVL